MGHFTGKVAIVTGAARGIGRGIALRLARDGASVLVNDFNNMALAAEVAAQINALGEGQRGLAWQADVSDRAAMERMFEAADREFGRLDIAVANAAYSVRKPVIAQAWDDVKRVIEVAQFGVFHLCQLAAQRLVAQGTGGKIIVISSLHGEVAFPNSAPYNMAKSAINHLVRTMAAELAAQHINVNSINPGWIDTPGERQFYGEKEIQEGSRSMPWGRLGTPEDIAAAAAFLASDQADYITGITLRVDGGLKLRTSDP